MQDNVLRVTRDAKRKGDLFSSCINMVVKRDERTLLE